MQKQGTKTANQLANFDEVQIGFHVERIFKVRALGDGRISFCRPGMGRHPMIVAADREFDYYGNNG